MTSRSPSDWNQGYSTPEARWVRLGPYYAMFPIPFVQDAIARYSDPEGLVIDPFCGRGTVPYIAMTSRRMSLACDINPVAWVYAATKTSDLPKVEEVIARLLELSRQIQTADRQPDSEFQTLAFCPEVLGFLNTTRRVLDWRNEPVDRCVAAFVLHYLHGKLGQALSNQMRHSKAMAPKYSVRWWRANGYEDPPLIDPVQFLQQRIEWRYAKGTPEEGKNGRAIVSLGDSTNALETLESPAQLVITSPPYSGITDYKADSWIRLWALGEGPSLPSWSSGQKHVDLKSYKAMLQSVFTRVAAETDSKTTWLIRCDARTRTLNVVFSVLTEVISESNTYWRSAPFNGSTQTALYGDSTPKPGEVDLLMLPPGTVTPEGWYTPNHEMTPFSRSVNVPSGVLAAL